MNVSEVLKITTNKILDYNKDGKINIKDAIEIIKDITQTLGKAI